MAHFSIELSSQTAAVYSVPGSGVLKVHLKGNAPLFYNPSTDAWRTAEQSDPIRPTLPNHDLQHLTNELAAIDRWRKDFYSGRLRAEYPMPKAFSNHEILGIYDEIDKLLGDQVPGVRDFKQRLLEVKGLRKEERERIRELYEIRNTLVGHNRAFEPTVQFSEQGRRLIESVRDKLRGKLTVGKAMIPVQRIYSATWQDPVLPKVRHMLSMAYSHIPILGETGLLEGLFSADAVLRALVDQTILELDQATTFSTLNHHIRIEDGRTMSDQFECVKESMPLGKLSDAFATRRDQQVRASIAFVTENGRLSERLLGLITVWDLPGNIV